VRQTRCHIHKRLKEHPFQATRTSVVNNVLDHVNERGSQHTVTDCSVRLLKEINHNNRLDVYESIYIYDYKKRSEITYC
jgi:hypothetical protein